MSHVAESITTFILSPDGLMPTPYQVRSLAEAVAFEPRGVYTLARTFHGDQALLLDAHLDRLEQSAHLMNISLILDRARLRAALRELLPRAHHWETKFRITIPRDEPGHIYLSLWPYQPVPEPVLRQGVHVVTTPLVRENPVAKTTEWMVVRQPTVRSLPPDVYEAVLMSKDGALLEGLSSNFYGVLDGVLRTAGEGVLAGIARLAIFEIAPAILPVEPVALHKDDIPRLTEAMITSSSRGVVPITRIDGHPVGNGTVGPLITSLRQRYDAWAEKHIEPI